MLSVPFDYVATIAAEFGAVQVSWRESERSFTGFVAEVWFEPGQAAGDFATKWAKTVGFMVRVRGVSVDGPARRCASVPCVVGDGAVRLGQASRGSRVRLD
jgi:hypothetical protein